MKTDNSAHKLAIDCIYEALIRLMNKKQYQDITITDITKKAGVSRMAYYRNYTDKDEILLRRLRMYLDQAEADLQSKHDLSQKEFWMNFVQSQQTDSINDYILRAGLFEQSFSIHKDYLMRIYTTLFGLDPADQNTVMLIYQKLGSIFGYIIYISENRDALKADLMIDHLVRLAEDGV